jgi:hypothetical protein
MDSKAKVDATKEKLLVDKQAGKHLKKEAESANEAPRCEAGVCAVSWKPNRSAA